MIAQGQAPQDAAEATRRNTVVIVDDHDETLASLRRLLRDEPYSLVTFGSPEAALRWISEHRPDVVIADERMPEMRGSDLLERVREQAPDAIRVILTGYPGSSTVAYGLSRGIDWLISKPWNNEALKLTIQQLIEGQELKRRGEPEPSKPLDSTPPPAGFEEATPMPLHCVGADGVILWANYEELELLERAKPRYIGHSIAEFHEDGITAADLLNRLSRNESIRGFKARLRCGDGTVKPVLIDALAHREEGRLVHAWCWTRLDSAAGPANDGKVSDTRRISAELLHEIAERRRAEGTLQLTEMRFRLLVENVKDYAILMLSTDGFVVSWNGGAERTLGYAADEILGRSFLKFHLPEDVAADKPGELLRKAAEQGRAEAEGWRVRKDGTRFWSHIILTAVRDPSGELLGFAKVTRDLTEQRRTEEERTKLSAQMLQGQKLQAIGQLSAGIAHEINNPVGYILSNLNTMGEYCRDLERLLQCALKAAQAQEQGQSPANALAELRLIAQEVRADAVVADLGQVVADCKVGGEKIRDIVRSLREFSHVDEGELKAIDLHQCLEGSLRICWNEIKYIAQVEKDYGDLPAVRCYPQRLGQVFINLLVNAGQALEKKGKIFLTTRREGEFAVISVRDTGRGIEPQNLRRIFEPFFTTKTVGSGTGLGLNVAYKIVIAHGGTIEVQSKVGEGTEFKVRLPLAGPRGGKP